MEQALVLAPRAGMHTAVPATQITEFEMSDCRNVIFDDGYVIQRPGYNQMGRNLPLAGSIQAINRFFLYDGTEYLVAATENLVYSWNAASSNWIPISVLSQADDCELNWTQSTNVTSALDAVDNKEGSNSVQLTIAAAFTTGIAAYRDSAIGDASDYGYVRLWIKSDIATEAGDLQLLIDDTAGCVSPLESLDIQALVADTWTCAVMAITTPAALTAVASLAINVVTDNGAQVINIDDITFHEATNANLTDADFPAIIPMIKETESEPWLLYTNDNDPIQKWTGTGVLADLGGSPPLAKVITEFKNHCLLLFTTESGNTYPHRIRWSDTGDPEEWTDGNANFNDLPTVSGDQRDWIVGAAPIRGDYLGVFKERSVWLIQATGDSDVFAFERRDSAVGCAAPRSIVSIGDTIYFLGWDDVYSFDGITCKSISGKIHSELIDDINPGLFERCFAMHLEEQSEYWLFVVSATGSYCDVAWCFNYRLGSWTRHELTDNISSFGTYELQSSLTIGDLIGSIGEQNWAIGERTTEAAAPLVLIGDKDGYVFQYARILTNDDDSAIDAWFSTKDFVPTTLMQRFRSNRMDVRYQGSSLDVSYSLDGGLTWTSAGVLSAAPNFELRRIYIRVDTEQIRWKFGNDSLDETWRFRDAVMYWEPAGERL